MGIICSCCCSCGGKEETLSNLEEIGIKKLRLLEEEREGYENWWSQLPMRVIIHDILSFHPFEITKRDRDDGKTFLNSEFALFGYFKKDSFRKIWTIFTSLTILDYRSEMIIPRKNISFLFVYSPHLINNENGNNNFIAPETRVSSRRIKKKKKEEEEEEGEDDDDEEEEEEEGILTTAEFLSLIYASLVLLNDDDNNNNENEQSENPFFPRLESLRLSFPKSYRHRKLSLKVRHGSSTVFISSLKSLELCNFKLIEPYSFFNHFLKAGKQKSNLRTLSLSSISAPRETRIKFLYLKTLKMNNCANLLIETSHHLRKVHLENMTYRESECILTNSKRLQSISLKSTRGHDHNYMNLLVKSSLECTRDLIVSGLNFTEEFSEIFGLRIVQNNLETLIVDHCSNFLVSSQLRYRNYPNLKVLFYSCSLEPLNEVHFSWPHISNQLTKLVLQRHGFHENHDVKDYPDLPLDTIFTTNQFRNLEELRIVVFNRYHTTTLCHNWNPFPSLKSLYLATDPSNPEHLFDRLFQIENFFPMLEVLKIRSSRVSFPESHQSNFMRLKVLEVDGLTDLRDSFFQRMEFPELEVLKINSPFYVKGEKWKFMRKLRVFKISSRWDLSFQESVLNEFRRQGVEVQDAVYDFYDDNQYIDLGYRVIPKVDL